MTADPAPDVPDGAGSPGGAGAAPGPGARASAGWPAGDDGLDVPDGAGSPGGAGWPASEGLDVPHGAGSGAGAGWRPDDGPDSLDMAGSPQMGPDPTAIGDRRGSGGPFEARYGYSRVVRVGPLAVTAGCTSVVGGLVRFPGDPAGQARAAFGTALNALAEVGAEVEHVVATRMYVTDMAFADLVGSVHGEIFGSVRPVATMVGVAALIDPDMLVEVELTAWLG